jgi:hypothetical protein
VAAAVMTVCPGVNVLVKLAEANVSPDFMIRVGSAEPISVLDEDRLIVMSLAALAGKPSASCSWTNMQAAVVLSEGRVGGLMVNFSLEGVLIVSEETVVMITAEKITRVIVRVVSSFLFMSSSSCIVCIYHW